MNSIWSWIKLHKWIAALGLIVVLVLGYFVVGTIAQKIQKDNLEKVRADLDTIYSLIVAQVGPPDGYQRNSICDRSQEEFGEGPLGCRINTFVIYGESDQKNANLLTNKIRNIVGSKFVKVTPPQLPSNITSGAPSNTTVTDYYADRGVNCQADYEFNTSFGSFLKLKDPNNKRLAANISCSSGARAFDLPFIGKNLKL